MNRYGLLLGIMSAVIPEMVQAEKGWQGRGPVVVMEAEHTASPLGEWQPVSKAGETYLFFTGNKPESGPPTSPLAYRFTVDEDGLYMLHLHCAKQSFRQPNGQIRWDCSNDAYVRLEGDFGAGPEAGDQHHDQARLALLQRNTKLFGGAGDQDFVWTFESSMDPGGHNNKRQPVYALKAGETYCLTVSGRSQYFRINRIAFRRLSYNLDKLESRRHRESKRVPAGSLKPVGKNRPLVDTTTMKHAHALDEQPNSFETTFLAVECEKREVGEIPFYVDEYRNALGINAGNPAYRDAYAQAAFLWTRATGLYDLRLETLGEVDGNSDYRVWVDNQLVGVALNVPTEVDYAPQYFWFRSIELSSGCSIVVEAAARSNDKIPEGDGFAYARGRWKSLTVIQKGK